MKTNGASRNVRAIAVLLLMLAAAGFVPASAQEDGPSKCLSQSDECEAARLATRVVKRLYETGDAGPLVEEFFLPDFVERFQKSLRAEGYGDYYALIFTLFSRDMLMRAETTADLRHLFVALVNAWHHSGEFSLAVFDVTEARHNLVSVLADDADGQLRNQVQKGALPQALLETLKSDPLLAMLAAHFANKGRDTDATDEGDSAKEAAVFAELRAASVQSAERLRSFTEKVEKCAPLLRDATKKLREELKSYPERKRERTIELDDVYGIETKKHGREILGFPAGTPFLSARLFPYVVVMVRVEGQLKVVGLLPDFDGD